MPPVSHGTSESRGEDRWRIHFEPHFPYAYEALWPALTTPEGLRGWLAEAQVLERRLGGAVTLRRPPTGTVATGHVTAWDVERVVEYTLTGPERIRFHLEPVGTDSTVIRFVHERGGPESERLDCLAGWHEHFELLESALAGRPADWAAWTGAHRAALRADYASPATA
ncbi:SRPBCC domain-containing protein [Streptomyces subrutilus]|uniref:SRPBCC domain-containing protein n=1 Tax=Streptomyces subrutilus TaxID=36818 RepID=UPI0033FE2662